MKTTTTDSLGIEHTTTTCDRCHKVIVPDSPHTTGYGIRNDQEMCFACCGELDREELYNLPIGGKFILYDCVDHDGNSILTNWPGTLTIHPHYRKTGKHNIAGKRFDMWFSLPAQPEPHVYHAVRYGNMTQIAHVRRIKA